MCRVKYEGRHEIIPNEFIVVFWCLGEGKDNGMIDETFGLEIQVDEYNSITDELHGINLFGFGYETWSQEVWEKWGSYIDCKVQDIPNTKEALEEFKDWVGSINCLYTKDENHLKDLELIKRLIQEKDKEDAIARKQL